MSTPRLADTESEPEAIAAALVATGLAFSRIGLEARPLSQWLHASLAEAGRPIVLLEIRQLSATTKSMPVKAGRNDARVMAQVVRTGWGVGARIGRLAGIPWSG